MSAVRSFNDFSKLQEIVVGSADGFAFPPADASLKHFFSPPPGYESEKVPAGTLARVVAETNEDLQILADTLTEAGVRVRRPDRADHSRPISILDWATTG